MENKETELLQVDKVRLTQFSRSSGCGCKIAPKVLEQILHNNLSFPDNDRLIVGNSSGDDAAVYDLQNGMALISTTDFFTPIVDDAFNFGRIASANAISDIYAMGGTPILAIAILGWPIDKLPISLAHKVIEGSRAMCKEAGISLAGGHSIDSVEPIFGLAVTGMVEIPHLKKNNAAKQGDYIFLTKPLGVGVLSTAQKRGTLKEAHSEALIKQMTQLNKVGIILGKIKGISAMTDVTGFGLAGHLIEMTEGNNLSVELFYSRIRIAENVQEYLLQKMIPDATYRNWNSFNSKISFEKGVNVMEAFSILPDPQTNGGLLFAANPDVITDVAAILKEEGLSMFAEPIGRFVERKEKSICVLN